MYAGPQSECIVTQNSLDAAFVDSTAKPAIIFRIAAKNDKVDIQIIALFQNKWTFFFENNRFFYFKPSITHIDVENQL